MSAIIKVQKSVVHGQIDSAGIRLLRTLTRWIERHQQRKQLAQMEDHLLKDIGLSRSDALQEAQKPFWKTG